MKSNVHLPTISYNMWLNVKPHVSKTQFPNITDKYSKIILIPSKIILSFIKTGCALTLANQS